jgi:microcystin degradation protein MlrC
MDRLAAARVAEPILKRIWETRAVSSLVARDPADACTRALELISRGRRVLIADFSDNPGGGGYGTTTRLLAALLGQPGPPAVFAPLCDADAAKTCATAEVGSDLTLQVCGEPRDGFSGPPLILSGRLKFRGDVRFLAKGPMWTNREMRLGPAALLACGSVDVVITSYPLQVTEPAYLTACGVDLDRMRIIAIKSLQHFRAAFAPLVDDILFADSGGLVSSDYRRFDYRKVRRPVWPLDEDVAWP